MYTYWIPEILRILLVGKKLLQVYSWMKIICSFV